MYAFDFFLPVIYIYWILQKYQSHQIGNFEKHKPWSLTTIGSVEVPKDLDLWGIVVDLKCFIGLQIWELFFYSCPLDLKESLDCSK